ncbi:hypothetical protein Daus18300_012607 [Diaporthe australafricana]|uniref:Uncharacterized protein n=1 Tax=Diaporthe australafricana TaxID=127596 RepID=A0ABR3W261_9PEZI
MKSEGSAKAFRTVVALSNQDFQAAAINPKTSAADIWTAWIWRFLVRRVFSDTGAIQFYSSKGEDAAYYMHNINEIDYLMQKADAGEFGVYARRLWKRQALSALFRTTKHSWLDKTRAAKVEQLSKHLVKVFQVFVKPMADGAALALARRIFTAAARLNEYMMTEANDIWSVDLDGVTGTDQDFYNNLDDMDLKPLGTHTALRDNLPLENIRSRLGPDLIKQRLTKLCVLSPAIRFRHIAPEGDGYQAPVTLVKPLVLVSLSEADGVENIHDQASHGDMIFYTMAQSLGLC